MRYLMLVGCVLVGCASSSVALKPEEQAVRLMKSDPPMQCAEAGQVLGRSIFLAEQKDNMKRQAAAMGANYVRLEGQGGVGTAFRCPAEVMGGGAVAASAPVVPIPVEAVRLMKADPPMSCAEAGQVLGRSFILAEQKENMKKAAAAMGANYVRLEGQGGSGTAFRCPVEGAAQTAQRDAQGPL